VNQTGEKGRSSVIMSPVDQLEAGGYLSIGGVKIWSVFVKKLLEFAHEMRQNTR